ncbi:MAG TPA: YdcF family protein [Hyphomonadaceae bacterium]|nr:YdcF family protein [Hyphomonadaceae bacterium]
MDLFFIASKVGWFFLTPSNLILLAMLIGVGLLYWKRARRIGWRIATGGAIAAVVVTIVPIGDWLIASLERRFPPYVACKTAPKPIAGIILLGGAITTQKVGTKFFEDLGPGADRIRKAAQLAHEYPDLLLVVSGGQAFPRQGARSEAVATADLLIELGVDLKRQRLETGSRTTAENAKFVADQTTGEGAWLLVTSAFHMPRSVGTFRKAGIDVIAAPTDWMVDDDRPILTINALDRLGRLDLGVHEYLGLIGYWLTGRSSGILPGPRKEDACPAEPPKEPPEEPAEEPAPAVPSVPAGQGAPPTKAPSSSSG